MIRAVKAAEWGWYAISPDGRVIPYEGIRWATRADALDVVAEWDATEVEGATVELETDNKVPPNPPRAGGDDGED